MDWRCRWFFHKWVTDYEVEAAGKFWFKVCTRCHLKRYCYPVD